MKRWENILEIYFLKEEWIEFDNGLDVEWKGKRKIKYDLWGFDQSNQVNGLLTWGTIDKEQDRWGVVM